MRTVTPILFDFHKQLEMNAVAQQFLDVATRAYPDFFQTTRATPDDDLLLRGTLHDDRAIDPREVFAHFLETLRYHRRDVGNLIARRVQDFFAHDLRD